MSPAPFTFPQVLLQLKAHVTALPDAQPADDAVYESLLGASAHQGSSSSAEAQSPAALEQQAAAAAATAAAAVAAAVASAAAAAAAAQAAAKREAAAAASAAAAAAAADPFNLDSLFEAPARRVAAAAPPPPPAEAGSSRGRAEETDGGSSHGGGTAAEQHAHGSSRHHQPSNLWHGDQVLCMWRQALLCCVDSARAQHAKHAWAKVSKGPDPGSDGDDHWRAGHMASVVLGHVLPGSD